MWLVKNAYSHQCSNSGFPTGSMVEEQVEFEKLISYNGSVSHNKVFFFKPDKCVLIRFHILKCVIKAKAIV